MHANKALTYSQYVPTAFDEHIILPDREDWFVAPASQTRDSGPLELSNFRTILADLGGEGEDVEVHRFGHWACGWFEVILVRPTPAMQEAVYHWMEALENYPAADDADLSEAEYDEFVCSWECWGRSDYVDGLSRLVSDKAAALIDDAFVEDIDALWNAVAERIPWEYVGETSGVVINIEDAVAATTRAEIAALIRKVRK